MHDMGCTSCGGVPTWNLVYRAAFRPLSGPLRADAKSLLLVSISLKLRMKVLSHRADAQKQVRVHVIKPHVRCCHAGVFYDFEQLVNAGPGGT